MLYWFLMRRKEWNARYHKVREVRWRCGHPVTLMDDFRWDFNNVKRIQIFPSNHNNIIVGITKTFQWIWKISQLVNSYTQLFKCSKYLHMYIQRNFCDRHLSTKFAWNLKKQWIPFLTLKKLSRSLKYDLVKIV